MIAANWSAEAAERALLSRVSTGDRSALDPLYFGYFVRLAKFFENMTVRADRVEELINDTMLEVWKRAASIGANHSVLPAIMRLAYRRAWKYFGEPGAGEPHSDVRSKLQAFLSALTFEERAVAHLVYASGCSRQEIAEIMRVDSDCVEVLLQHVREGAKLHLRAAGIGTSNRYR